MEALMHCSRHNQRNGETENRNETNHAGEKEMREQKKVHQTYAFQQSEYSKCPIA